MHVLLGRACRVLARPEDVVSGEEAPRCLQIRRMGLAVVYQGQGAQADDDRRIRPAQ